MSPRTRSWIRLGAAAACLVAVSATMATAAGESAAGGAARRGPIVPKPGAPDPRPFTLADRYLDAAQRGDRKALEVCIDKGVDLGATDAVGRSALVLAVRDARDLELAKFLHAKGLPVDEPDATGRSPLADAAGSGETGIVDWLIEEGASIKRRDAQGRTPLFGAVIGGNLETARRLIEAGAEVDVRDNYGDTPLMGACSRSHEDVARLLVESGADPVLIDQEGRTAAQRAPEDAKYCRGLEPPAAGSGH